MNNSPPESWRASRSAKRLSRTSSRAQVIRAPIASFVQCRAHSEKAMFSKTLRCGFVGKVV
jgi:hypothetical protein